MKKELKIGIFAVVVIVASFFVLNYLRGKDVFNKEIDLVGYCDNAQGLVASAPVYIKGYKAGQVSSVEYNPQKSRFDIVCSVRKEFDLTKDSRMVIYNVDIMGGKGMRIEQGTSDAPVEDGDTLSLVFETGMIDNIGEAISPLIATVTTTLDSLQTTIAGINKLLSDDNIASLSRTFRNIESTIDNLNELSESVNGKSDEITSLIADLSEFSAKLKPIADKVDSTVDGLNVTVGTLNEADIKGAVTSLKELLQNLNNPEGSLGKLLTEDSVYNSVDSLLNDINILVDNIKENPRKYLKISVF
ncbi:MAG: MCE family protein [Bacteroidales bacterium]|nr:MCE family protein [Bacteroidales bacterium]